MRRGVAYSAFNVGQLSRPGWVSGKMASAGHSGSHTPKIDAFVGMNHEHVFALVGAIDRANLDRNPFICI
jgi:hypothetical protein